MKQVLLLLFCLVIFLQNVHAEQKQSIPETVNKIRIHTLKNLQQRVDVRHYSIQDPDYLENSMALNSGKRRIKNRTLILKDLPAHMASYLGIGGKGMLYQVRPDGSNTNFLYVRDGSLFLVYIINGKAYPNTTRVYNVSDANGQLQAFAVNVSSKESYLFDRAGQFLSRCVGVACDDLPTSY